ncbi:sugar phosphate isomerase/epimerase [Pseudomonas sp. PD9R]|uniref:sugar phosphate isomerase/epimerase family protein n=1 Tax=Pseudomonas sp. PD9R TaxID=2853534 RepID=UPI001C453904|nr:sugar phosphate isomerase/epimerase family protein [Pseudomonas sp. PD9R]MBV6824195.1 sugar phosphate isomerase/epimerase [Pseudomonas sp. PD9R]
MIKVRDNNHGGVWPEYVSGTAQQNYLKAEVGILEAAKQGYSHWYIDGSLPGERPSDWTESRIDALRETILKTGVKPIYHGNFKAPLGSDVQEIGTAALDYIKREVDLSAALGGAPVIVHGGGVVEPRLVIEARRMGLTAFIDNLGELVDYARERNVEIWLENLSNYTKFHPFYYICVTEDEYAEVLGNVPGLKFFFDVSHAHVNDGDPVKVFDRLHQYVVGMSFSDNKGERDSHFPLGRGSLDYPGLVKAILKHEWRGLVGFETRGSTLSDSVAYLNSIGSRITDKVA